MDLLFQTEGTAGNTELKELLGFIDADLKLKNLIPDLLTSTNEVIELIGQQVYNEAIKAYNGNSDIEKKFVFAVRYPIAINAYRLYAPSNDISHTNNGRKMRQDDGEKLPFEWMIDRDNDALEKRYYRALDDLIKFLDQQPDGTLKTAWINSDAFKSSHNHFLRTVKDFDTFFPIKSKLLLLKLMPGINDCEQYEIRPRVGVDKFNALKALLKNNNDITDEKDIDLIRLIKKACVSYSLAWAMPRLSVQLFPEGVLQHHTSDRATTRGYKPTLKSETQVAKEAFLQDSKRVFAEIEQLMKPPPEINEENKIIPDQLFGDKFFST